MAKLRDFFVGNFSGGQVNNKSDYELDRNELKICRNWEVDERGRLKRRLGVQLFGDILSLEIAGSYIFTRLTLGSTPTTYHLVVTKEANADLYKVVSTYLTADADVGATTLSVGSATDFAAAGDVEIDGDIISYTGGAFNGVTGILSKHKTNALVTQLVLLDDNIAVDTRCGVYFAVLNNVLFINGRSGSVTFDGSTVTAVSDANEAAGIFATEFRERVYVAGSGVADASGTRNGIDNRVSYTDPGDSTDWGDYTVNFFDVEDDLGERITGMKKGKDVLLIFKENSTFVYDEVQLKQTMRDVGAWNNNVVKEIGDQLYTFCEKGVFVTNGYSYKKISEPIEAYLKYFRPRYDNVVSRVVVNCSAAVEGNKYKLYIDKIDEPEALRHLVFVYDTVHNNWRIDVMTLPTNASDYVWHMDSLSGFASGTPQPASSGGQAHQHEETHFAFLANILASTTSRGLYKFNGARYLQQTLTAFNNRGGDYYADFISNSTGNPISALGETKFYELSTPHQLKIFPSITSFIEQGEIQIAYKLDLGMGRYTDWISLGNFRGIMTKKLRLDANRGYRISFRITSASKSLPEILDGILIRDPEIIEDIEYADVQNTR